jgi:diacylglycerol kinase family enzyme
METRTFIIRDAQGKELGRQEVYHLYAPFLEPGQTADLVLTKEEAAAQKAAERAEEKPKTTAQAKAAAE